MHKRLYVGPYPNRYPVFRTLGIPSGFIVALSATLHPPPPARERTVDEVVDDLRDMLSKI